MLYLKRAVTTVSLSKFGMVYYNNLLSVPLLLGLALLNGELGSVWAQTMGPGTGSSPAALQANGAALGRAVLPGAPLWVANPLGFVGTMLVSGVVGFALNGASLWCVQATSPSTFSMVGALNKIPLAVSDSAVHCGVMETCVWVNQCRRVTGKPVNSTKPWCSA